MRKTIPSLLMAMLLLGGCADDNGTPAPAAGSAAGSSSVGGSQTATGGTQSTSGAGSGVSAGNAPSYVTYGGSDSGGLFGPNAVPFDPASLGGSAGSGVGGSGGSGGSGPPGDGNVAVGTFRRGLSGTVTFTQTGTDVTAEVDITGGCPGGDVVLTIHDGYSCDNADTEGVPWGERGEIGTVTCNGSSATGTFMRAGSDPNTNWTVADHNLDSDLTGHVLIGTPADDATNRIACANFF